jgi:beta-lactamase class D
MNKFIFTIIFVLFIGGCTKKHQYEEDLSKYFNGYKGCFVLYDSNNKYYIRYNEEQCSKRLSPCSTFKIPNSLIGLETGVITDENFTLKWDGTEYPIESWNSDHNLKSAIKNSVVWYYREIARRIGEEKMREYIHKIGYGNEDISGGIDKFWLMSSIKISANEQVEFLKELYNNKLPFLDKTLDVVKDILILEKNDKYTFSGKTGSGSNSENKTSQGWFVGVVMLKDNTYFFATNIEAGEEEVNGMKAKEITIEILKSLKIM